MSERENILGRVREALRIASPSHGEAVAHAPSSGGARAWLPKTGETADEQLAAFQANAAELKAQFVLVTNREDLFTQMRALGVAEKWNGVATHRGELASAASASLGLPTLMTDAGYDVNAMESCSAAITECDALVAQTGSVLVTSRSAGGRALSVLPPHHVVVAHRSQLVRDLPAAFALLQQKYSGNYPSMISFITGPSRTGDIERILVLGAHGPKKLTIFCLQD